MFNWGVSLEKKSSSRYLYRNRYVLSLSLLNSKRFDETKKTPRKYPKNFFAHDTTSSSSSLFFCVLSQQKKMVSCFFLLLLEKNGWTTSIDNRDRLYRMYRLRCWVTAAPRQKKEGYSNPSDSKKNSK